MRTSLGDGKEPIDEINPYFLGSIVLIKEKEDKPDSQIVDGQQRLTTLTILLAVLRTLLEPKYTAALTKLLYEESDPLLGIPNRCRLTLAKRDEKFFKQYIQDEGGIDKLKNLSTTGLSDSRRNITENALLFLKLLDELSNDDRFRIAQFIIKRCFLVVVSTPDIESAYRIFSVLNDRGLVLSITDILKAEIIGKIADNNKEEYASIARYTQLLIDIENEANLYADSSSLQLTDEERCNILQVLNGDLYPIRSICLFVLLRLDAALSEGGVAYKHPKTISIEHVLPQNLGVQSVWFSNFTEEEHKKYIDCLGNLVLLSCRKNSAAQNFEFKKKKEEYFKPSSVSSFALTTQVVKEEKWTPEVIKQRQKNLIDVLKEVWRL